MSLKPLGVVKEIVEAAGMGISYAYEDLVFLEHNSFMLQFAEDNQEILIHINTEADKSIVDKDIVKLQQVALLHEMHFKEGKFYTLSQDKDDNIRIEFSEAN